MKYIYIIAAILVVLVIAVGLNSTNENVETTKMATTTSSIFNDSKKLESIRNREEVKKQQDLMVQEIYLNEEIERLQNEKETLVKEIDSRISTVEKEREKIRELKLSF